MFRYEKTRHGTPHIMESGIFNQECWITELRLGNSVVTAGEHPHKNHVLLVRTKKEPLLFVYRCRSLGPGTFNGQEILRKKTRSNFSTPA
jgi:hypothetical protein